MNVRVEMSFSPQSKSMSDSSKNKAKELVLLFFNQLSNGCESIKCSCKSCASCPEFNFNGKTPNEIAKKALALASEEDYKKNICPGLNLFIKNNQNPTFSLNEQLRKAIMSEDGDEIRKSFDNLFSNPNYLPYLLLSKNQKLKSDLSLNNEDFELLIPAISNYSDYLEKYQNNFYTTIIDFTKSHPKTFYFIRFLIICFCFDNFLITLEPSAALKELLLIIHNFEKEELKLFQKGLASCPRILQNALVICQTFASMFAKDDQDKFLENTVYLIDILHQSTLMSENPLPMNSFYNEPITKVIEDTIDDPFDNAYVNSLMTALTLEQKSKYLTASFAIRQIEDFDLPRRLEITVSRDNIVEDSIDIISRTDPHALTKKLSVNFSNEIGIDAGGISREFFYLLISSVFSPDYGMFKYVNESQNVYWFLHNEFVEPIKFNVLGTVIALAFYNSVVLPIRFPTLLYKKLVKIEPTINDLAEIEPSIASSLKALRKEVELGKDISEAYLTFTTMVEQFGDAVEVDVVPNGSEKNVTNDNLEEYIEACIKFHCTDYISREFDAFKKGFQKLIRYVHIKGLLPDELDVLVSGLPVHNWDQFKESTKYEDGYTSETPQVKWFWNIFDSFSDEEKGTFLRFVTGSDRTPVHSSSKKSFVIKRSADTSMLPVSHSCFNILCLPQYESEEIMREKLLIVMRFSNEGFGLL